MPNFYDYHKRKKGNQCWKDSTLVQNHRTHNLNMRTNKRKVCNHFSVDIKQIGQKITMLWHISYQITWNTSGSTLMVMTISFLHLTRLVFFELFPFPWYNQTMCTIIVLKSTLETLNVVRWRWNYCYALVGWIVDCSMNTYFIYEIIIGNKHNKWKLMAFSHRK